MTSKNTEENKAVVLGHWIEQQAEGLGAKLVLSFTHDGAGEGAQPILNAVKAAVETELLKWIP